MRGNPQTFWPLVYRAADDAVQRLSWFDRMGNMLGSSFIHGAGFALSPDNSQVVFVADGNQGLMLLDFERGTQPQRFTTGGRAASPVTDKRFKRPHLGMARRFGFVSASHNKFSVRIRTVNRNFLGYTAGPG